MRLITCINTVCSVSWNFPGLELNVNELQARISSLRQEYSIKLFWYKGVLAVKGCMEKFGQDLRQM